MRFVADPLAERRQNARLADARPARDERDLTFVLACLAPAVEEQRHLMLAPYEGRQALGLRRLKAADVLRLTQDRPGGNRRVEAFQGSRSKRLQLERAAQEPPRGLGDHHGARLGQRLQSRRQIGRFADDGLFLRRAPSDKIADHNDPSGDADADLEIFIRARFELRDDRRHVEAGPDRALGVLLVGAREAEIGQHAIAHEFGDEAVITQGPPLVSKTGRLGVGADCGLSQPGRKRRKVQLNTPEPRA